MDAEDRLDDILSAWRHARDRGEHVDPREVIDAHPDLASALRRRFAALAALDAAFQESEAFRRAIPDRLGTYKIEAEIGAGGMGTVYRARSDAGSTVALKTIHPHLLAREGFFKRFLREAEIGRTIDHPNVVRTLDADALLLDGAPHHFLVMEYVEGRTLRTLLADLDRVPEELCRHLGREICRGLDAVHAAGAVHRDLKPDNVIITPEHNVKVMDLGVAQVADEQLRLSRSGAFVGSVEYGAPEQFGSRGVDARCDLHALGVLLYELACGQHPYRDEDVRSVIRRICDEQPRALGEINPQLSPYFEELVHTLLAKKPEDRFESAAALLSVLEEGERSEWWRERARSLRATTRRPLRRIRVPRETAVYGRDDEFERLRGLFAQVLEGEGQVLLVEGEAGIGKSRLVDEFVGRLQADGVDLDFLFGSYAPGAASAAHGAFSTAFREHFGEAGAADHLAETPLLVPAFDAALRGEPAPPDALVLTRESLATCFVNATRSVAAERPSVVLIEDLHNAPEEARELFLSLALAVPGHRVLLVGTLRPGLPEDWLANMTRLPHSTRIELPRLGAKDLVRLLEDTFRSGRLADELGAKIALKSDGNPFFVFEIIQGLREGQFITQQADGTWVSTRMIEHIQVPSSVLDLVNARVADLSDDERNLLDVAACWGFDVDPTLAGEVLGLARIPALQSFAAVEKRHRLVRSAGRNYVFDHHQVQEALYGALNDQLREEYHAALADVLERRSGAADEEPDEVDGALAAQLCHHYLAGARGKRALRYLEAALGHLGSTYASDLAIELADRALAVVDLLRGADRVFVLLAKSERLELLGRREAQELVLEEARSLAKRVGNESAIAGVAKARGVLRLWQNRYSEAREQFQFSAEVCRKLGDREGEARAAGNEAIVFLEEGNVSDAEARFAELQSGARETGDKRLETLASSNLATVLLVQGRVREARELLDRALLLCRETADRRSEARTLAILAQADAHVGAADGARAHREAALAICRAIGDRQEEAKISADLAEALWASGWMAEATEHHRRALGIARELGQRGLEAELLIAEGCMHWRRGRLASARTRLRQSIEMLREIGSRRYEARAAGNLGFVLAELGDTEEARRRYESALALARETGDRFQEGYWLAGLARLADESGEEEEALRLASAARDLRREIGHLEGLAESWILLGATQRRAGRFDVAGEALQEALSLISETRNPGLAVAALAVQATLPGRDASAAEAALESAGRHVGTPALRFQLWQATRRREHLLEAKRLLDDVVANAPEKYRKSMLTNVRVNREILAAWREEFGEEGEGHAGAGSDEDDAPDASESATRIVPRE